MAKDKQRSLAKSLVQIKIKKDALIAEEEALRKLLTTKLHVGDSFTIVEEGRTFLVTLKEIKETILADNQRILEEIGIGAFKLIAKISKSALEAVSGKAATKKLIIGYNPKEQLYVKEV